MQEIITFKLKSIEFTNAKMKLLFGTNTRFEKILYLVDVVSYVAYPNDEINAFTLSVREGISVYGMDMSYRLKNEDYKNYKEVFLTKSGNKENIVFRILCKEVKLVDYNNQVNFV